MAKAIVAVAKQWSNQPHHRSTCSSLSSFTIVSPPSYPISTRRILLPTFQHAHTPVRLMESQGFRRHMMCLKFRNPACHIVLHCPLSSRRRCSCRLGVLSLERFAPLIRATNRSYPTAKADDHNRWTVRWRENVHFSAVSRSLLAVYGGVQDGGVNVLAGRKIAQPEKRRGHLSR